MFSTVVFAQNDIFFVVRGAKHFADKDDRYWLAATLLVLIILLVAAVRWFANRAEKSDRNFRELSLAYEKKLETICLEVNETNKRSSETREKLAVAISENTRALDVCTNYIRRVEASYILPKRTYPVSQE